MTTTRSTKQSPRPGLPLIAATTATLPAVMLSSLAVAQPAAADSQPKTVPATLAAAIEAQAAAVKAGIIPAAAVPAAIPAALQPTRVTPTAHTVVRGDTVSGIAGRHGVRLSQVLSWNGLKVTSIIYPGQKIRLGAGTAVAAAPAKAAAPAATRSASYVIKSGDTLSGIAARHG